LSSLAYGRFLLSISIITTPIMIMTMMIAMPMYSSALWVAMPLSGVAVGAAVAAGELAWMYVEAEDP
jgi:hypothetical protein